MDYPGGLCLRTEKGVFWIKQNYRFRIPTDRVLESWNFATVIETTEAAAAKFKVGGKLGFRDGTLIKNVADGKMYLISLNKRRHITNPDWVALLGNPAPLLVSDEEAQLHGDGEDLK